METAVVQEDQPKRGRGRGKGLKTAASKSAKSTGTRNAGKAVLSGAQATTPAQRLHMIPGSGGAGVMKKRGGRMTKQGGRGRGGRAKAGVKLQGVTNTGGGMSATAAAGGADDMDSHRVRGIFRPDLRIMMYGFGDAEAPLQQSVELVEEILVSFVSDVMNKACSNAAVKGKVGLEDIFFLMRKDSRKYARIKELLAMQQELKEARAAFKEETHAALAEEED